MPNIFWCRFMACLLKATFKDKIDRFTYYDGDKQIGFESIFSKILRTNKIRRSDNFDVMISWSLQGQNMDLIIVDRVGCDQS